MMVEAQGRSTWCILMFWKDYIPEQRDAFANVVLIIQHSAHQFYTRFFSSYSKGINGILVPLVASALNSWPVRARCFFLFQSVTVKSSPGIS